MILDSSALVAILEREPGWEALLAAAAAGPCVMSAATWIEAGIVADSRSLTHGRAFDRLVEALEIDIVPVSREQAELARETYRRYGKGSGSPAHLNIGDCFSYALAVITAQPLLFVGEDFTATDVRRVPGLST